ncbi:hypothetical protein [Methylobacterium sp. WCS2018Hpa-22]|uniref:hypothetical protein n=1 Tax=Methylobacterium sp. WCS2018Hpa-22 TaxID=3073633 RepID=UPI002889EF44|nr:hypothetical protein [Methylobacterium sp. WCS2018Hpa-22]
MDDKSVNKIVAAILAGHAASATGKNTSATTYVQRYISVLTELNAYEKEESDKVAKDLADTMRNINR